MTRTEAVLLIALLIYCVVVAVVSEWSARRAIRHFGVSE